VLPHVGYRVWCSMVPIRRLSDATPIARGTAPLTILILTIGIGACAEDRRLSSRLCPTFASANIAKVGFGRKPAAYPARAESRLCDMALKLSKMV
jgi:hypothetical protein